MASADRSEGREIPKHNYVANDKIWKDHVVHEQVAARSWQQKWNFMSTRYEDLVKDEYPPNERKKVKAELLRTIQRPRLIPLEDHVQVLPSNAPVPKTTANEVGWRSSDPDFRLEKYGKYSRPRGGLVKQFNWPKEGVA